MSAVGVKRIDRDWLEDGGACEEQVELFALTFPDGVDLGRANLMAAARAGLNLEWLAEDILPAPAWRAYAEARAPAVLAYEKARVAAVRARAEAIAAARARAEAIATALADALGLD